MVVVNDVDGDVVRESAQVGGLFAAPGDASTEAGVELLVGTARELAGPVDVCCANGRRGGRPTGRCGREDLGLAGRST
jgi:hypothetical protein